MQEEEQRLQSFDLLELAAALEDSKRLPVDAVSGAVTPPSFVEQGVASIFGAIAVRTEPSFENARFEAMRALLIHLIVAELERPLLGYRFVASPIAGELIRALIQSGFSVYEKPGSAKFLIFLPGGDCKLDYLYREYVRINYNNL